MELRSAETELADPGSMSSALEPHRIIQIMLSENRVAKPICGSNPLDFRTLQVLLSLIEIRNRAGVSMVEQRQKLSL